MKKIVLEILIGCVALSAGCVKVHFEPETKQQQTDAAMLQGKDMRSQWAERLRAESTGQKLRTTKTFVDSVVSQYLQYGDLVAERWRAGNQSQPQPMTDIDARAMVSKGTEAQHPMFKAYEDMLEYAIEQIKLTHEVDDSTMVLLTKYGDHLYATYSAVFYPTGTEEQFEERLYQLRRQGQEMSRDLAQSLQVYR